MFRYTIRARPNARAVSRTFAHTPARFASSSAGPRRSTFAGTLMRWGAAGYLVYWYNTSPLFELDPSPLHDTAHPLQAPPRTKAPTVEEIIAEKRSAAEARERSKKFGQQQATFQSPHADAQSGLPATAGVAQHAPGSMDELEDEAGQQGAFNPDTGEINWDCPCLGGMAHGPCGDQFRRAFSCFVFSEEEPKGIGCIDHFQTMQNCFKRYPEYYAEELAEDGDSDDVEPSQALNTSPEQKLEQQPHDRQPVSSSQLPLPVEPAPPLASSASPSVKPTHLEKREEKQPLPIPPR